MKAGMNSGWIPMLMGALIVIAFLAVVFYRVRRFFKALKVVLPSGKQSETMHVESPFGTLDFDLRQQEDSGLESIPIYPGAVLETGNKAFLAATLDFAGKGGRFVSRTFKTPEPLKIVREYYEREFPQWERDKYYDDGDRYEDHSLGFQRTITLKRDSAGTIIEHGVTYPKSMSAPASRF